MSLPETVLQESDHFQDFGAFVVFSQFLLPSNVPNSNHVSQSHKPSVDILFRMILSIGNTL